MARKAVRSGLSLPIGARPSLTAGAAQAGAEERRAAIRTLVRMIVFSCSGAMSCGSSCPLPGCDAHRVSDLHVQGALRPGGEDGSAIFHTSFGFDDPEMFQQGVGQQQGDSGPFGAAPADARRTAVHHRANLVARDVDLRAAVKDVDMAVI